MAFSLNNEEKTVFKFSWAGVTGLFYSSIII